MYLFVLNFKNGKVYRYEVKGDPEEFLDFLGFDLSNIQWMVTNHKKINDEL